MLENVTASGTLLTQKTILISVELYRYLVEIALEQDNDFPAGWDDYIDIDTLTQTL